MFKHEINLLRSLFENKQFDAIVNELSDKNIPSNQINDLYKTHVLGNSALTDTERNKIEHLFMDHDNTPTSVIAPIAKNQRDYYRSIESDIHNKFDHGLMKKVALHHNANMKALSHAAGTLRKDSHLVFENPMFMLKTLENGASAIYGTKDDPIESREMSVALMNPKVPEHIQKMVLAGVPPEPRYDYMAHPFESALAYNKNLHNDVAHTLYERMTNPQNDRSKYDYALPALLRNPSLPNELHQDILEKLPDILKKQSGPSQVANDPHFSILASPKTDPYLTKNIIQNYIKNPSKNIAFTFIARNAIQHPKLEPEFLHSLIVTKNVKDPNYSPQYVFNAEGLLHIIDHPNVSKETINKLAKTPRMLSDDLILPLLSHPHLTKRSAIRLYQGKSLAIDENEYSKAALQAKLAQKY